MTVQIIITGDNGRQAAVELKSFIADVVDLFGAAVSDGPAQTTPTPNIDKPADTVTITATNGDPSAFQSGSASTAAEPVEAVEEAPKKRGRPAKKAAAPKPEPTPEPETAEEEEEETDEDDDAPVEDDMVAGYAVTEEGFRAAFRAWAERHEQDYIMENGVKMIGASKIPDLVAQGTAAIAEALRRVVADSVK